MKIAVYSGTFDPVTNGHLSVLERGARLFDHVYVAVARQNYKSNLFNTEERLILLEDAVRCMANVTVEAFDGLLVDFAKEKGAVGILRGLRVITDFEYEMQMASFNKYLCPSIDTVYLTAAPEFSFVSSSMIRNIAELNGDVSAFVPSGVAEALREKYGYSDASSTTSL